MNVIYGRNNLALTIYTQSDCKNNCKFCVSKNEYGKGKVQKPDHHLLRKLANYKPITDLVITGGEPLYDLDYLEYLFLLFEDKHKFINTTLPTANILRATHLLEKHNCLINVSRHGFADTDNFPNTLSDDELEYISQVSRINCVIPSDLYSEDEKLYIYLARTISRWNGKVYKLYLRKDFTKTTEQELHQEDEVDKMLKQMGYAKIHHSQCNVCDNNIYRHRSNGLPIEIDYHKGLESSSVIKDNTLEVNDLIIFPDGELYYDWNKNNTHIQDVMAHINDSYTENTYIPDYSAPIIIGACGGRSIPAMDILETSRACGGYSSGRC